MYRQFVRKHFEEEFDEEEEEEEINRDVSLPGQNFGSTKDADFIERNVFPSLIPAMEETLSQAKEANVLEIQRCRFNGLDRLAEILWNRNPRRDSQDWINLFEIEPFRDHLRSCPRPVYPKSWLMSDEEAALIIQKWVRGWLIRKREDVQEMRRFWMAIASCSNDLKNEESLLRFTLCKSGQGTIEPGQFCNRANAE